MEMKIATLYEHIQKCSDKRGVKRRRQADGDEHGGAAAAAAAQHGDAV